MSAYLKLRGDGPVVPARVGRAGPARRALVVPRRPAARGDPLESGVLASAASRAFDDPYAAVAEELARYRIAPLDGPAAVRRRRGRACSATTSCAAPSRPSASRTRTTLGMPDLALMVTDVLLAFDHLRHEVTVLANVFVDGGATWRPPTSEAAARDRRRPRAAGRPGARRPRRGAREPPRVRVEHRRATAFAAAVERAKEYIRAGDVYQVVPSQRWSADCPVDAVLDLPRPARDQPEPVHVLPRLRGLRDRRRLARVARDGHAAGASSSGRSPARARAPTRRGGPRSAPTSCWPTRRSAPST